MVIECCMWWRGIQSSARLRDAAASCREGWKALRPAVTRLVAHMVDESFDWEHSAGAVLPHLEALTLIASDFQPTFLPGPPVLEDLYVQSLPGRALQPYARSMCGRRFS